MNPEQLITQAGDAMAEFARRHNCSCYLSIKNGIIVAGPRKKFPSRCKMDLIITRWQQVHGLTTDQWDMVGKALFDLYNKELSCQTHQKP